MAPTQREQAEIAVSPCTDADMEAVEALWPRRGCAERFARQQSGDSAFLLARWTGDVVGRVEVMWTGPRMPRVAEHHPGIPEINGLDVLQSVRRRGIGTALLLAAENMARPRGCHTIGLGVGLENPQAERIYRRLGYAGDLAYTDTYVWIDEDGQSHDAADPCRFLMKALVCNGT